MIFKLDKDNLGEVLAYIAKLEGGYSIEIKKRRAIRSLSQNKYYWGVVVKVIGEFVGENKERIHSMLASLFLRDAVDLKNGNSELTVKSTTELTSSEFEVYLKQVRQWAQEELDVMIPEPNEVNEETWDQIQKEYDKMFY